MNVVFFSEEEIKCLQDAVAKIAEVLQKTVEAIHDGLIAVGEYFREAMKRRKFPPIKHLGNPCAGWPGKILRHCRSNC